MTIPHAGGRKGADPRTPVIVVTLGTDHHPFARLVDWVDSWAAAHPDERVVVQHGTAPKPRHAEGHVMLNPLDIPGLMHRAAIVVGHAGPGTLLDARAAGRRPVLVPRLGHLGEAVDDHQVAFGRVMHDRGQAICVDTEELLHHHIDAAVAHPERYAIDMGMVEAPPAVTLVGDIIDGMMER